MARPILAAALVLGAQVTAIADAAVIQVPADTASIQAAIGMAAAGDVVRVAPGIYHERIDLLGKAVTVTAPGGPETTIIDGSGLGGTVVRCGSGEGTDTVLEGFTITGGTGDTFLGAAVGGGMLNLQASPTIRGCVFTENDADGGGGMCNFGGSPTVTDCVFRANAAGFGDTGGGGMSNNGSSPVVTSCTFVENVSAVFGGGMSNLGGSPVLVNCTFIENHAALGGAIRNAGSSPAVTNCTLFGNVAQFGGAIRSASDGDIIVRNSILWENGPEPILDLAGATIDVAHSAVQGGWPGAGNTGADPLLSGAAGEPYRLAPGSPCIDAGDNAAVPANVTTDIEGNDRIFNGVVDMGVYEPTTVPAGNCPSDLDGTGTVDFLDLLIVLGMWGACSNDGGACAADVDGDGVVGFLDLVLLIGWWGACP